jgi:LacI family fructose operon transcriptional repressor
MTIFKQPTYEIGKTATELLLNRIADPDRPSRDIVLKGKLLVRDSCRRPGTVTHSESAGHAEIRFA